LPKAGNGFPVNKPTEHDLISTVPASKTTPETVWRTPWGRPAVLGMVTRFKAG
jgi:hypothetical protein